MCTNKSESPMPVGRKACHLFFRMNTHFYPSHACCTKFKITKTTEVLFSINLQQIKNHTLQTNESYTLRSHKSMQFLNAKIVLQQNILRFYIPMYISYINICNYIPKCAHTHK